MKNIFLFPLEAVPTCLQMPRLEAKFSRNEYFSPGVFFGYTKARKDVFSRYNV